LARVILGPDMGDIGSYLASIDFRLAVLVAVIVGTIAMLVRMFIQATAEEGLVALPLVGSWIARAALARRRSVETRPWFCTICRSLNAPAATHCYRGCGARADVAAPGLPTDMPIDARAGTSRRRG
jgi:hypothetical protein